MQQEDEIQNAVIKLLNDELSFCNSLSKFKEELATFINELINNNFERLVSILYRIDVSEEKLKLHLAQNRNSDAGHTIAALIIARQIERLQSLKKFKPAENKSDEERW